MLVREKPPLRLSIQVTTPAGRRFNWNEQDPTVENVPNGLRFSSSMPGGFESCDCSLPRKPSVDYSDLERLSNMTVRAVGGDVCGEYRLERSPRTSGAEFSVSPSASGYQAALADDSSVRQVYVERDLSRWQEGSRQRKEGLFAAGFDRVEAGGSEPDLTTGLPGLKLSIQGVQSDAVFTATELWLDTFTGWQSLYYDYKITGGVAADTGLFIGAADDDVGTGLDDSADLYGTATGAGTRTPTAARRWARWVFRNQQAWADETERVAQIRRLAVFGDHGLSKQGTAPDEGLWDSDIVRHAVQTWTPLNVTDESIQDGAYVIMNMAFTEPTTVAEVITQASRFTLRDWAVWDNQTFWYTDRGSTGRRWRARIAPAQLEETGPQIDRLWESVIVQYQDVDGSSRTVGPPDSNADAEDAVLKDNDPDNPVNKAGIVRRSLLSMGTATLAEATEVGRRFLVEQKLLDTSGRAQAVGYLEDDKGVWRPASLVRAGDYISFVDASDSSYRRIVKADYDHNARTCSMDLDSPPEGLAALLERLGAILLPLGLS